MKKKYLYNGKIMQASDVIDAAKQSNLDLNTYLQKSGIKPIDDSYSLNGKDFSSEDILDAANQSKLGFDDYIQKAGFQKKNGGESGQPQQANTTSPSNFTSQESGAPNPFNIESGLPQKLDNTQPQKQVTPFEFVANRLGVNASDFNPNKIYNSASQFIRKDLENHPMVVNAPHPDAMKNQIINGDGDINIQMYAKQRNQDIANQQQGILDKITDEVYGISPDASKINTYKNQLDELEKQKEAINVSASEINDIQAVKKTPQPTDPKQQTDYFRAIGRDVNRFKDPIGIANQEKNITDGTNGARDKELVDTENYANEQAGIEAKKKQLSIAAENGEISGTELDNQLENIKIAEKKLLSNNPGAKSVIDRNILSKIIDDTRNQKGTESDPEKVKPFSGSLFHDIINYTPSDNEVKNAIKIARDKGYAITADEEKKYIADKTQIPGTSSFGNLFQSSIGSLSTAINNYNPFLSNQEIEGEKYREERLFQPTQRQTDGVLGYVNQTANVVGTVLKWGTLGKFLGGTADAALGNIAGAETVGGVSETLGGVRKLSAAQQNIAGTALTSGLLVYPEAKEDAKKFTTDESKQSAYAGTMTLLNTLAFTSLNPHGIISKILGNMGESNFTKEFLKVVNKAGGVEKLEPETFKTTLINGLKTAAGANISASATMTILNFANQATDVMFDKKPNIDMGEVGKEAVNSFISFAPISLLQGTMGAMADKNKRNITIQLVNQAAKDPLAFKDYMDNAVDQGQITRDEANKKISIINTHATLNKAADLPPYLSEENKAAYVDNLRREIEIKHSIKTVEDDVSLKSKEDEIKSLQAERQHILEAPAKNDEEKLVNEARNSKQLGVYGSLNNEQVLKEIAMRAQNVQQDGTKSDLVSNKQAYDQTVRQFGDNKELVNTAIAKHPLENLVKPVEPDFTGKDNNFLANKEPNFFTSKEIESYNELMKTPETEAQAAKMVADKKEEIKNFAPKPTEEKQSTVVSDNKEKIADIEKRREDELTKSKNRFTDENVQLSKEIANEKKKPNMQVGKYFTDQPAVIKESFEARNKIINDKYDKELSELPKSEPITNKEVIPEKAYRSEEEANKLLNEKIPYGKKYNSKVDYEDVITGEAKTEKTYIATDALKKRYEAVRNLIVNCLT